MLADAVDIDFHKGVSIPGNDDTKFEPGSQQCLSQDGRTRLAGRKCQAYHPLNGLLFLQRSILRSRSNIGAAWRRRRLRYSADDYWGSVCQTSRDVTQKKAGSLRQRSRTKNSISQTVQRMVDS